MLVKAPAVASLCLESTVTKHYPAAIRNAGAGKVYLRDFAKEKTRGDTPELALSEPCHLPKPRVHCPLTSYSEDPYHS